MIISKVALVFVTSLIIFSVFVANVANLINVELQYGKPTTITKKIPPGHHYLNTSLDDNMNHLIWFLQISDIHISIFQDKTRITELREFCERTVATIAPKVVLASGDLTDAKTSDHIGSRQYEDEWRSYNTILNDCQIDLKTKWLDIRGNHDNFNVASITSGQNYFSNYSVQGRTHRRSYMYQIKQQDEVYSFIGVDATLDPGPRRPFNFVGVLSEDEIRHIQNLASQAKMDGSNYIIWFGHYPTSCILSPSNGVRSVFGQYQEGLVYLCGHLHQLGGIVKKMYTLQKAGFLELELGDWKDNRMYRLAAIDHGLLSFIDIKHGDWPVILITNPKHALYVIPDREPGHLIATSTHIRILAFSLSKITKVKVRINGEDWRECSHKEGPFYTASWIPAKYSSGVHTIEVNVKDEYGRDKTISQPFATDNSRLPFGILARILLMTNASTVLMFGSLLILSIIPLCILRVIHKLVKEKKLEKPLIKSGCVHNWIRKLWVLVTIDRIFYPLVIYPVYLCLGPWSAGYIVEEHFGVIFAWGIFVRGAYLPGSFTYVYGFIQLFTFQIPFTLVIANNIDYNIKITVDRTKKMRKWYRIMIFNMPFFCILGIQLMFAYFFWLAYGTIASLLGPLRTWTIIYAVFLWMSSQRLPDKCIRDAIKVWYTKNKIDLTDEEQEAEGNLVT